MLKLINSKFSSSRTWFECGAVVVNPTCNTWAQSGGFDKPPGSKMDPGPRTTTPAHASPSGDYISPQLLLDGLPMIVGPTSLRNQRSPLGPFEDPEDSTPKDRSASASSNLADEEEGREEESLDHSCASHMHSTESSFLFYAVEPGNGNTALLESDDSQVTDVGFHHTFRPITSSEC